MRRAAAAALILAFFAPSGVVAQSMLTVAYDKTISLTVAGATSAYAVNPSVAEAGAIDGTVQIRGVGAGVTNIIVVTRSGTTTLAVTVTAPQVAIALGAGGDGASFSGGGGGFAGSGGSYDGTYTSGGGAVTNAIEFHQQEGSTYRRAVLVTATYVSASSGSQTGTGVPLISYEIKSPGRDLVFLDQAVSTSPLTFEDALIRGAHLQTGPWAFHAGASSITNYGAYFIPTNPQWVFGATRGFKISQSSDVAANVYDIVNTNGVESNVNGGLIGSLLYTYHPQPHFIVQGEVGMSRSIGLGASMSYEDSKQQFDASLLDKPQNFASLVTDAQQGLFGTLNYTRIFSDALNVTASAQKSDYELPVFRENTLTAQGTANYRLSKDFSVSSGALYSNFASIYPVAFNTRTLAIPISFQYATRHFTAGVQYQPTTDFSGTLANGYGGNVGYAGSRFQLGAFYNHNVDIPTISSIFSEVPGLQAALEQAGINVSDPAQLAALLNNAALLASLGFAGLQLNIAPARNDLGVNANWTMSGARRAELSLSYLSSNAQLTDGAFDFRLASLTYLRRIDYDNELMATVSRFNSVDTSVVSPSGGGVQPSATSRSAQTTYGLAFRHRFGSAPAFLFPTKRGTIDGYVFRDEDLSGSFSHRDAGLSGIEVTLDNERATLTDASGHYSFGGVPFGTHAVAAHVKSPKPFFFTTDSPASAQIGSTVNFGINYEQGRVFGYVTNDAGQGIPGVVVAISGLDRSATSEDDGRFVIEGVPQGRYVVTASPDSFPTGYDLSTVSPVSIDVTANAPWPLNLSARALRSISGTVMLYDPRRAGLVPAAGMEISIPQLGIVSKTDGNGIYTLRDLPAGTYAVQVDGIASERRAVTIPAEPTTMTGIDFRVTAAQVNEQRLRRRPYHRHK